MKAMFPGCAAWAAFGLSYGGISAGMAMATSGQAEAGVVVQEAGGPVSAAIKKADAAVAAIIAVPNGERTFANTVGAIDDLLVRLDSETAWPQFWAHVSTDAEQRNAGQAAEEQVTNWK